MSRNKNDENKTLLLLFFAGWKDSGVKEKWKY